MTNSVGIDGAPSGLGASPLPLGPAWPSYISPSSNTRGGLATKRANATAIFIEALADWAITLANLSLGNLRPGILIFSTTGVLIGAQLGALWSPFLPDRVLKTAFALCVLGIGLLYVTTSLKSLM